MKALVLIGLAPLAFASAAAAQDHSMHDMSGKMPAKPKAKPAAKPRPAARPPARRAPVRRAIASQRQEAPADPHAGHDMSGMPGMQSGPVDPHAGHDMSGMAGMRTSIPSGTDLPPGAAPAPAPPRDRAADRYWGAEAMAEASRNMRREHGGGTFYQIMFNLAEYQAQKQRDGYRWDGEAWIGGDINRFWLKSAGEGTFGEAIGSAEIQALYGRALDPYWNLQAGIRQDLGPGSRLTYAALGVEGVAPYWLELEGALFLSTKGDLLARVEGYYDQRITQDLVLQPRAELNFAAQNIPENGVGAGLSTAELGLRLRYERARELAPYVGISWERKLGNTADFARRNGDGIGGTGMVAGVRAWF